MALRSSQHQFVEKSETHRKTQVSSSAMKSKGSFSIYFSSLSTRKKSVVCSDNKEVDNGETAEEEKTLFTAQRLLLCLWMCVGLVPLLLQARSYIKFMTPHKITQDLVEPADTTAEVLNRERLCPVEGLMIAGAWWNIGVTHYYTLPDGHLCHFVVNIHGAYLLGTGKVTPHSTTPSSCSGNGSSFHHYFCHGSIGYFTFYEEASGTYCFKDQTAYVEVNGLGTYYINGSHLAEDGGAVTYRRSYWYGLFGAIWITYRSILMRRSYISCKRYGRRCDNMQEKLRFKIALVYVQESMRLSAHGARNYHRVVLLYLLVEGLMSGLFMLIAQDGLMAKVQYISSSSNAVLSYFTEKIKFETYAFSSGSRVILCMELGDHGVIVLGIVATILSIRATGALIAVRWAFGSFRVFTAACCVDTAFGVQSKMILLGGYDWEEDELCYKMETLKAFGLMNMEEEDGTHFLVTHKLHWVSNPRQNIIVIGEVHEHRVQPCNERPCTGIVSMIGKSLGGPII